jgi:acetoin utilization protein AcuB
VNAADLMTRDVVTLEEGATLGDAMATISEYGVRHLPILSGKRPIGVLSDRDLRRLEGVMTATVGRAALDVDPFDGPVSSILEGIPVTVLEDASLRSLIDTMLDACVGSVLVVDLEGSLVGIVSYVDVLRAARDKF